MRLEPSSSGVAAARQETLPLFHAAWLFAAGVAATHFLWLRPWLLPAAMIPTAILCCVAAFKAQRMLWLPLAVLWALLGAWCGLMEPWPAPVPQVASFSDGLMRTLEGTAVDVGPVRSQIEQDVNDDGVYGPEPEAEPTQRVDVQLARLEEATDSIDRQIPVAGTVRLTLRWPAGTNVEAIAETFHCGDHIRADARLLRPAVYHDPGVWSRADYLLGQGITSTAGVAIDRVAIDRSGDNADVKLRCRLSTLQHAMTARLMGLPATTHGLRRCAFRGRTL